MKMPSFGHMTFIMEFPLVGGIELEIRLFVQFLLKINKIILEVHNIRYGRRQLII
ncbi:hypothetical protein EV294_11110 [Paenibacillus sp. BK033]|nr:hypothetical protein EV294_11110 [Paenibacillus sp. BK033]